MVATLTLPNDSQMMILAGTEKEPGDPQKVSRFSLKLLFARNLLSFFVFYFFMKFLIIFLGNKQKHLCFPEIVMPQTDFWSSFDQLTFDKDINTKNSLVADGLWVVTAQREAAYIKKQKKWDSVDLFGQFQGYFVKEKVQRKELKGYKDYCYFPRLQHFEKYLTELLTRNPFFMAALTKGTGAYSGKFVIEPFPATPTWFSKIVATMNSGYSRFKAVINADFSVGTVDCLDSTGNPSTAFDTVPAGTVTVREYKIIGLLLNIAFFAELVHATLHVYHYCMCAAIEDATRDSDAMRAWAKGYYQNVPNKYSQVETLLFNEGGALSGSVFIADHDMVVAVGTELMMYWGTLGAAERFINEFLCGGVGGAVPANTLTQFSIEAADINAYANEVGAAFEINNTEDMNACNGKLRAFFTELVNTNGNKPVFSFALTATVNPFRAWIELMSVTGLLHAGTFSFSRLLLSQPVLALLRPGTDKFDEEEVFTLALISGKGLFISIRFNLILSFPMLGTILGIDDERAVYGNDDSLRRKARKVP